jgi:adenylylsulfate kinase
VRRFQQLGKKVEWLDGDVTRKFIPTTGYHREERDRHVLSTGFLARTLEKNGINVIASYISPYQSTRESIRKMCRNYVEIHVDAPLSLCEERDVKGLYRKARSGDIKNFTGIDSPYEPPVAPELVVHTDDFSPDEAVDSIMNMLKER